MKTLKIFFVLLIMFLKISCSTISVNYDYNPTADFSSLKTYNWIPIPTAANIDRINVDRMRNAVNTQLEAKGLEMKSDNPDFLIATHIAKKEKIDIESWGYNYGYYSPGGSGVSTFYYEEGTIILDFVDPKTKDVLWRGTAKGEVDDAATPEKKEKRINEAIQKMLENFPPPSK